MSRAPAAGFSDFFPAAPRIAKIKAKERERAKTRPSERSPLVAPKDSASNSRNSSNTPKSRDEAGKAEISISAHNKNEPSRDATTAAADDGEQQGDLLNCGVRSASSHTSAASSVFSATGPSSKATVISHAPSLTPLTNDDLSSNGHTESPRHAKVSARNASLHDNVQTSSPAHVPAQESKPASIITHRWDGAPFPTMRDPTRTKGQMWVPDVITDTDRKRTRDKGRYKDITWVRSITYLGSAIIGVH